MGKICTNGAFDAMLGYFDNSTRLTVCTGEPTTYAQATSAYSLAIVTIDSGDFTIADGDSSGRKVTVAQQSGISIGTTGTASHVALSYDTNSELVYVTTCTAQALTSGGTVTVPSWKIEVADPT